MEPVRWWVRKDLRLSDNPALVAACAAGGPVIPVFILDEGFQTYGACPLWRVGLGAEAAVKYPHEFSGGQRQRISIARALATQPRFLICDEPTSALDVSIQAQILNILKDLQEHLGLTMLFISHDLPVVRQMCDRVGVLKDGKLVELQATEALFADPQQAYTQELLRLMPKTDLLSTEGINTV